MKCEFNECINKVKLSQLFKCNCDKIFCRKHKFYSSHKCDFDYYSSFKILNSKNNVKIEKEKVVKI